MACDIGTSLFVLQFSTEPDVSYIAGIYLTEAIAKTMANTIIGAAPTWLPKRTNALHLAGYVDAGNGLPGFNRGVDISVEQHALSEEP